jgi:endonuclease/exonuclease/phosphatase family metal-dependent hydrolase
LYQKIQRCGKLIVVCGDFNMLRYCHEKRSGGVHNVRMDMFNGFIDDTALMDFKRVGSSFTWSNKQRNHVTCTLDKFLVSRDWEQMYPKVHVRSLIRVGSNHSPILLDNGVDSPQRRRIFRFEKAWLSNADFKKRIIEKWSARGD